MIDALEVSLILLACTTPALAIIALVFGLRARERRRNKLLQLEADRDSAAVDDLRREVLALRARVEVLETIVTERDYQLKEEFRSLERQSRQA